MKGADPLVRTHPVDVLVIGAGGAVPPVPTELTAWLQCRWDAELAGRLLE